MVYRVLLLQRLLQLVEAGRYQVGARTEMDQRVKIAPITEYDSLYAIQNYIMAHTASVMVIFAPKYNGEVLG